MKLASMVGSPLEKLIARMPAAANEKVNDATQAALRKCLQIALRTLGRPVPLAPRLLPRLPPRLLPADKPSNLLHKFASPRQALRAARSGLFALPVELPVTDDADVPLDLRHRAQRGRGSRRDRHATANASPCSAWAARRKPTTMPTTLFHHAWRTAQAVSKASSEIAAKGFTSHGSAAFAAASEHDRGALLRAGQRTDRGEVDSGNRRRPRRDGQHALHGSLPAGSRMDTSPCGGSNGSMDRKRSSPPIRRSTSRRPRVEHRRARARRDARSRPRDRARGQPQE